MLTMFPLQTGDVGALAVAQADRMDVGSTSTTQVRLVSMIRKTFSFFFYRSSGIISMYCYRIFLMPSQFERYGFYP